ncbi:unnamed protein product [Calicophoron daubneyi]|uniref:Uncharacterized protein n=1 Tax=Calicophoron daubneyi TaxID=300641 RepID=A0AAV2TB41_CALDB
MRMEYQFDFQPHFLPPICDRYNFTGRRYLQGVLLLENNQFSLQPSVIVGAENKSLSVLSLERRLHYLHNPTQLASYPVKHHQSNSQPFGHKTSIKIGQIH